MGGGCSLRFCCPLCIVYTIDFFPVIYSIVPLHLSVVLSEYESVLGIHTCMHLIFTINFYTSAL